MHEEFASREEARMDAACEVVARTSLSRSSSVRLLAAVPLLLVLVGGCRTPDARRPLDETTIVERVAEARAPRSGETPLPLAEATERMRRNNPHVRNARTAYRNALRVASVRTPRPNPSVDLGPLLVGSAGILSGVQLGVELMYGWTVPLTGRLRMQDDVNAVRASLALVKAAGVERTEYLSLRGELLAVMMWSDALQASQELLSAAEASVAAAQTAAEAGAATKLDVGLLELEAAGQRAEVVEADEGRIRAAHAVAQRIGMSLSDAASVYSAGIPPLPQTPPALEKLRRLAVEQHPRLATLRAEYTVAERELRLEMARRYPDLGIGLGFEDEVEDQKLGLPLGIEIPLYDRNQQGIARAYARRCQLRQEFASHLIEIYGRIEASRARVQVAMRRLRTIEAQRVPAEEVQRLAEQMRDEAGGLDMLRFLEVFRTTRRVRLQTVEARLDVYEAWSSLESAAGSPLLVFAEAP